MEWQASILRTFVMISSLAEGVYCKPVLFLGILGVMVLTLNETWIEYTNKWLVLSWAGVQNIPEGSLNELVSIF